MTEKFLVRVRTWVLLFIGLVGGGSLSGCLMTRQDLKGGAGDKAVQAQAQQQRAQQALLQQEFDEQFKGIRNKIEVLEHRLDRADMEVQREGSAKERDKDSISNRLNSHEEALRSMEAQLLALKEVVEDLRRKKEMDSAVAAKKDPFELGEELFQKKQWREAILAYQKYRDSKPKGKQYAEATYKIGVSFQELKLKDEAKVFYEEVINKFPSSKESKSAKTRLKTLN